MEYQLAQKRGSIDPTSPSDSTSVLQTIAKLMRTDQNGQLVHIEYVPPQEPSYATPVPPLLSPLARALQKTGISRLYSHQVQTLSHVRSGKNVVVVTATSSGKTLCYNIPILESILHDRTTHAIYLYPVNALINDQFRALAKINLPLGNQAVSIERYIGSTRRGRRAAIQQRAPNILLTNPEMLHLSFLLWHEKWQRVWSSLRYIVIDEIHSYRGVFGANMAYLLRRMQRMARHYGSDPQFICCSATIANPRELCERLTGQPFEVVNRDGSRHSGKLFVLWNPVRTDANQTGEQRSYIRESVDLFVNCLEQGQHVIMFTRARQLTERMLRMAQKNEKACSPLPVRSYRAGYLPRERAAIEAGLKTGEIKGVIATTALELGIDIGELDVAIISGYPGSMMSVWQQAGRAGRRDHDALIFLVASQNPVDQYLVHHPKTFFSQNTEKAIIDLTNPYIRIKHLACAARELAFTQQEITGLSPEDQALLDLLQQRGLLRTHSQALSYDKTRKEIHLQISLRAAGQQTFRILDGNRNEIGFIEPPNVFRETHPGAIYQHQGDNYRVTHLDLYRKTVRVRPEHVPHYTRPIIASDLRVEHIWASRWLLPEKEWGRAFLGEVLVRETVSGYMEIALTNELDVKRVALDNPLRTNLHTTAMWLELDQSFFEIDTELWRSGLHAIQHLLADLLPLIIMCDRRDVDNYLQISLSTASLFLYDAYEGGMGFAESAYNHLEKLLWLALETVRKCPCAEGCPGCIQSSFCRRWNQELNKRAAISILERLLRFVSDTLPTKLSLRPSTLTPQNIARERDALERVIEQVDKLTRRPSLADHLTGAAPPAAQERFEVGDRVQHLTYGSGLVIAVKATESGQRITVRFTHRNMVRDLDPACSMLRKLNT